MNEIEKIIFKYDNKQVKYYINDKEVSQDEWIKAKSTWECEEAYNHIKRYIDKWGYTSHDYYTKDNIDVWAFTTVKK